MTTSKNRKIKVLIVDDSALIRKLLKSIIESANDIVVVGAAADPYAARQKIKELNPDVLTLDVEMPKMDGIAFLSNLMRLRPMPVVMVSSLTTSDADVTLQALELGAIDFVCKPKVDINNSLGSYADEIISKIRIASTANVRRLDQEIRQVDPRLTADAVLKQKTVKNHLKTTDQIIAIGASTGGTEAIKEILSTMPPDAPGIVITQHIPETFSKPFAERMDRISAMTVFEASHGQQILSGHVYVAPGNRHLIVQRSGARYLCSLDDGLPVNRHKPSVDVMFRSVAQNVGPNAVGVLLTGMGIDGAAGLKELRDSGAVTIIQDKRSSVVWGMPGEASRIGACVYTKPLRDITESVLTIIRKKSGKNRHSPKQQRLQPGSF